MKKFTKSYFSMVFLLLIFSSTICAKQSVFLCVLGGPYTKRDEEARKEQERLEKIVKEERERMEKIEAERREEEKRLMEEKKKEDEKITKELEEEKKEAP
jgi:Skp family chaperone for outer membrane proteins